MLLMGLSISPLWANNSPNVQEAIDVIVLFCVAGGDRYDIKAKARADGSLALKKIGVSGGGEISISKSEARGLVQGLQNAMTKVAGDQASEARACMKPYIDRILDILLSPPSSSTETKKSTYGRIRILNVGYSYNGEDPFADGWTLDRVVSAVVDACEGKRKCRLSGAVTARELKAAQNFYKGNNEDEFRYIVVWYSCNENASLDRYEKDSAARSGYPLYLSCN